jgi:drug/metabolite transporter (DMT)-like permease
MKLQGKMIGFGAAFFSAMLFSIKGIFAKKAYEAGASAEALLALRFGFTLPVFVWIALASRAGIAWSRLNRRDWGMIAALSLFGYVLSSALDFHGLRYLSVGMERLILYVHPTMVVLLSAWLLKRPLRPVTMAALLLSYAGLVLCFVSEVKVGDPQALLLGGALVFAAAFNYALFLLGAERAAPRVGMHRLTAIGMVVSAVVFGGHALAREGAGLFHLPSTVYLWALLMAGISTVLPVWLFGVAMRRLGASRLSVVSMAGPVAVLPLAAWLLGEPAGLAQWGGFALTLTGGMILTRAKAKPVREDPASKG